MPLLTTLCRAMRVNPMVLIRRVSELKTVDYDLAVTFVFPDTKLKTYRRLVQHVGWQFNTQLMCSECFGEPMSKYLLFGKIAEPELIVINFNDPLFARMNDVNRGQEEVRTPKSRTLDPTTKQMGNWQDENPKVASGITEFEKRNWRLESLQRTPWKVSRGPFDQASVTRS